MKLYAIRNKNTGEIMDRWNSLANNAKIAKAGLAENGGYEIVTLRVEPAEACGWCDGGIMGGEMFRLTSEMTVNIKTIQCGQIVKHILKSCEWELCPNCGRVLG